MFYLKLVYGSHLVWFLYLHLSWNIDLMHWFAYWFAVVHHALMITNIDSEKPRRIYLQTASSIYIISLHTLGVNGLYCVCTCLSSLIYWDVLSTFVGFCKLIFNSFLNSFYCFSGAFFVLYITYDHTVQYSTSSGVRCAVRL